MPARKPGVKEMGVTSFKAHCLAVIEEVAQGKTRRVLLLKHDRPVAAVVPAAEDWDDLWGAMKGTVTVARGVDLTDASGEVWEADE